MRDLSALLSFLSMKPFSSGGCTFGILPSGLRWLASCAHAFRSVSAAVEQRNIEGTGTEAAGRTEIRSVAKDPQTRVVAWRVVATSQTGQGGRALRQWSPCALLLQNKTLGKAALAC